MNPIDINSLEFASWTIVVDDVNQFIRVEEDPTRNPDTSLNDGYLKVVIKLEGDGRVLATAIMHFRELQNIVDALKD